MNTSSKLTAPPPLNEHPQYRREPSLGPDAVIFVTKADAEGILAIDKGTGFPLTKLEEMPEWGEGIVTALLAERIGFYNSKLGADHDLVKAHLNAETVAFEDIAWFARSPGGADIDIKADEEVRLGNVQSILTEMGVVATAGEDTVIVGSTTTLTRAQLEAAADSDEANTATTTAELAGQDTPVSDLTEKKEASGG